MLQIYQEEKMRTMAEEEQRKRDLLQSYQVQKKLDRFEFESRLQKKKKGSKNKRIVLRSYDQTYQHHPIIGSSTSIDRQQPPRGIINEESAEYAVDTTDG